jgi:hypothetical protein
MKNLALASFVSLFSLVSFAGPLVSSGGIRGSFASCRGEVSGVGASLEIFPSNSSKYAPGVLMSENGTEVKLKCAQTNNGVDNSVIVCFEKIEPNQHKDSLIKVELTTGFSGLQLAQVFTVTRAGAENLIGALTCQ